MMPVDMLRVETRSVRRNETMAFIVAWWRLTASYALQVPSSRSNAMSIASATEYISCERTNSANARTASSSSTVSAT